VFLILLLRIAWKAISKGKRNMATSARAKAAEQPSIELQNRLSTVLPKDFKFSVFHLSTPPTRTDSLCSAPPGERPDRTYCENHFLAISIDPNSAAKAQASDDDRQQLSNQVLVLALEIFIFTTAFSSVFFVSKADSTGYMYLLNLPKGSPSPTKEISTTFIEYLVEQRKRKDVQSVVSLFARAQAQYLFPRSVENSGKHILDDRGLVRWWCRVLNPMVEEFSTKEGSAWTAVTPYLVVPGLDHYETRAFLPRTPKATTTWVLGHPLDKISHYCHEYDTVPPRCLIPRYPDDPVSRFRDELDEEAAQSKLLQTAGLWKSVRTLDQFWEMMAFRQECSSGRMTGFIWVVFDVKPIVPKSAGATTPTETCPVLQSPTTPQRQTNNKMVTPIATPRKLFPCTPPEKGTPSKAQKKKPKKKTLKGEIKPRQPQIKTEQRNYLLDTPESTAYYYWPAEGRGRRIVDESGYKRAVELLLRLDFGNLELAKGSTKRWVSEVGMGANWGFEVTGTRETPTVIAAADSSIPTINNLSGMIKRKRSESSTQEVPQKQPNKVNVLSAGLVRRRSKEEPPQAPPITSPGNVETTAESAGANVLSAGLVRKKPKAT
jgi:regulator of Ty1 transposition protein 109